MNRKIPLLISVIVLTGLFVGGCAKAATPVPTATSTITPSPTPTEQACTVGEAETLLHSPGGTESVAVASDGTIYTADVYSGTVYRIDPDGGSAVVATIPLDNSLYNNALGVAVSDDGAIWVAVSSVVPQLNNGIWRIGADGSTTLAFPMDPNAAPLPNDLVFDPNGTLYITESSNGAIWRASPGGIAKPWLQDDLLASQNQSGGGIGADGIAFRENVLYVGNFAQGTVLQIPVETDGSPGKPVVIAKAVFGIDALDFDALGHLYGVSSSMALLIRILPDGGSEVVLNLGDMGLISPSGIAFAQDTGHSATVYISDPSGLAASISRLSLCPPG
jgi:sugar lactone lactonase YvrE